MYMEASESKPTEKNIGLKAKEAFSELGISFVPGTFQDIHRITSRDTQGESYPYNAGFSEYGKVRKDWLIVKDGIEIGYYYTGLKDEVGEIGMLHLAPALRNRKLSTLLKLLGSIQLIEDGAQVLRSVAGDDTGKIEGINQKLGFKKTEKTVGLLKHPVWELTINDKNEKLQFLSNQFEERFAGVLKADLSFDPKVVDVDNPNRVSIKETVLERLMEKNIDCDEKERLFFGYVGAPIVIFQEYDHLVLRVQKTSENDYDNFEKLVDFLLPGEKPLIFPYPTDLLISAWEIVSPKLKAEEFDFRLQKFAEIGERFFKTNSQTI